jgi:hypothetical protein
MFKVCSISNEKSSISNRPAFGSAATSAASGRYVEIAVGEFGDATLLGHDLLILAGTDHVISRSPRL